MGYSKQDFWKKWFCRNILLFAEEHWYVDLCLGVINIFIDTFNLKHHQKVFSPPLSLTLTQTQCHCRETNNHLLDLFTGLIIGSFLQVLRFHPPSLYMHMCSCAETTMFTLSRLLCDVNVFLFRTIKHNEDIYKILLYKCTVLLLLISNIHQTAVLRV